MKKLYSIIACALLLGVAMYWYFHRDSDRARDVLPADAVAVAVFQPSELAKNLGLEPNDIKRISSTFEDLNDAFDLTKPIYVFTTETGLSGFSLNVKDADKVAESLDFFGYKDEEQGDLHWIVNDGDGIGLYDKEKMLVCKVGNAQEESAIRSKVETLMQQKRQKLEAFGNINKQDGELKFTAPLKLILEDRGFKGQGEKTKELEDAVLNTAFKVENHALSLTAKLDTPTDLELPLAPIKGNLGDMEPADACFRLCVNMNGEQLLPYLREVPQLRSALLAMNMSIDADMMIKAIDGDVSLSIPRFDLKDPDFVFIATLANTDFLTYADEWGGVTRRGASDFATSDGNICFGVRDGKLYICSKREIGKLEKKGQGESSKSWEAKGKYLSASIDIAKIVKAYPAAMVILVTVPAARELLDGIEQVTVSADTKQSLELRIETKEDVKELISKVL